MSLMQRVSPWLPALLLLGALTLGAASTAQASHYYLTDVTYFSKEQIISLRDTGIQTTEHFLTAAATPEGRTKIAAQLQLEEGRVLEVAKECELLQIKGVGPKAVKLLQGAGVTNVDDLAKRKPDALLKEIVAVNKANKITEINPTVENITNWVTQAKQATTRVK